MSMNTERSHKLKNGSEKREGYSIMKNNPELQAINDLMKVVIKDPMLRFLYKDTAENGKEKFVFYCPTLSGPIRITKQQDYSDFFYYTIQICETLPVHVYSYQMAFVQTDQLIKETQKKLNQKQVEKENELERIQNEKIQQQTKALLELAKKVRQK